MSMKAEELACCAWYSKGGVKCSDQILDALEKDDSESLKRLLELRQQTSGEETSKEERSVACCPFCQQGASHQLLSSPLHDAAERGSARCVQLLLQEGDGQVFLGLRRRLDQRTPFALAVRCGHSDVAVSLLEAVVGSSLIDGELASSPLLHEAAQHGMDELVEALCSLAEACDVDTGINSPLRVRGGLLTPLECAARAGHSSTCRLLLQRGVRPNGRAARALLAAVRGGCDEETLEALVKAGADVNAVFEDDGLAVTSLLSAAGLARTSCLRKLLKLGARVHERGLGGRNALSTYLSAVRYRLRDNDIESVLSAIDVLCESKGALTSQDDQGRTPLHHVLMRWRCSPHLLKILKTMLRHAQRQASVPDILDEEGVSVLHMAMKMQSVPDETVLEATTMLLAAGANPSMSSGQHGTALLIALSAMVEQPPHLQLKLAKLLLENGAEVDGGDGIRTPLISAFLDMDFESATSAMDLLLLHGATVNQTNKYGETVLHRSVRRCCSTGQWDFVKLLIERGVSTNVADCNGFTPLHLAAQGMSPTGLHILLRAGADITARNQQDDTVLHMLGRQPTSPGTDLHQDLPAAFSLLLLAGAPTTVINRHGNMPFHHLTRMWIRCAELADRLIHERPLTLQLLARTAVRLALLPENLRNVEGVLGHILQPSLCSFVEGDWVMEKEAGGRSDEESD